MTHVSVPAGRHRIRHGEPLARARVRLLRARMDARERRETLAMLADILRQPAPTRPGGAA